MKTITRDEPLVGMVAWNPTQELQQLSRRMDTLFKRFDSNRLSAEHIGFEPTLDVYETPEAFAVFVTAPGLT